MSAASSTRPSPLRPAERTAAAKKNAARDAPRFRCVTCGMPAAQLLKRVHDATVVDTCTACGAVVDPFVEHDDVHVVISVMLLKGDAWRHIVYNSSTAFTILCIAAITAVFAEALTAGVVAGPLCDGAHPMITVANSSAALSAAKEAEEARSSLASGGGAGDGSASPLLLLGQQSVTVYSVMEAVVQPLPALRVLSLVNNTRVTNPAPEVALRLVAGSASESLLTLVAVLWLSSALAPRGRAPSFRSGVIAFSLTSAVRLAGLIFYLWDAPLYFLLLIDAASVMWTFKALGTLTHAGVLPRTVGTVFAAIVTRVVVRTMTGWAPVVPAIRAIVPPHVVEVSSVYLGLLFS